MGTGRVVPDQTQEGTVGQLAVHPRVRWDSGDSNSRKASGCNLVTVKTVIQDFPNDMYLQVNIIEFRRLAAHKSAPDPTSKV